MPSAAVATCSSRGRRSPVDEKASDSQLNEPGFEYFRSKLGTFNLVLITQVQ